MMGTRASVPRIGRVLDLVGLVLLVAGGLLFTRAWIGLEGVRHYRPHPDDLPWAALRLANHFLRMQRVGGAVMLAGAAVFVAAWWVSRRATGTDDGTGTRSSGS